MTHNKIQIGCDRSGTPNTHKNSSKTVNSRKIDGPFRLHVRKHSKSTTWTLIVKNPDHSNDANEDIMAHTDLRKLNKKETSQIAQMSELLLIPRQIQAQLCSQRESDRPVMLKDIYNQVRKIKKEKLQGRIPIDSLVETHQEEKFVWYSERNVEGHITSFFSLTPLP
ncbi:hypothetical protein O181_023768 [Austropuccinia psidii MF-1]|uniref:Uncharacterized protein n=1 Tax=Austropuccinia psidii MF-1 TaxID=1389203 RepID=A0A9Q3CHN9_9BASI|nr:hypothetical protein [Austropuccinia psidii MF-1]